MPDTGFNGYLSVAPDGTVVVPNNIDVNGVITTGDLASHTDVADALTAAEDYTDAAVAPLALQADLDALAAAAVIGAGLQISDEYSVHIDQAAGDELAFDFVASGVAELDVATSWIVLGQFIGSSGELAFNGPQNLGGGDLNLNFTAQSTSLEHIVGDFFFRLLYTTA